MDAYQQDPVSSRFGESEGLTDLEGNDDREMSIEERHSSSWNYENQVLFLFAAIPFSEKKLKFRSGLWNSICRSHWFGSLAFEFVDVADELVMY